MRDSQAECLICLLGGSGIVVEHCQDILAACHHYWLLPENSVHKNVQAAEQSMFVDPWDFESWREILEKGKVLDRTLAAAS